jgi:hypothetical protein
MLTFHGFVLVPLFAAGLFAQQPQQAALTDSKLMGLAQAGVSEAELLRMVATAPQFDFDLRPVAADAMMKAGVSENVIKAMAARENGAPMPSVPAASVAPTANLAQNGSGQAASATPVSVVPVVTRTATATPISQPATVAAPDGYEPLHQVGGHKLTYNGGSIANLKTGAGVTLYLAGSEIRLLKGGQDLMRIPAAAITEISYGQDVHRRVGAAIGLATVSFGVGALMALTKSKKHFIGLTWNDTGTKGGAAFQADKSDYRGVLEGLEGITGKRAINSDTMTVKN